MKTAIILPSPMTTLKLKRHRKIHLYPQEIRLRRENQPRMPREKIVRQHWN